MRNLRSAVVASALALPSFAQQQPPVIESIEVRVASIDVVVRDKAGNPVIGLTKDDFELFDDKVQQSITNFYEVKRGEAGEAKSLPADAGVPLEVRQRRVVVFVDAASLTPAHKSAILESVRKFVETGVRPEDRVMLVTWRMGLRVVTPFTSSKDALRSGVETITKLGPAGEASATSVDTLLREINRQFAMAESDLGRANPAVTMGDAFDESRNSVERYAKQLEHRQEELLEGMRAVAASLAGIEGKKVLLFVGETLQEHPGADLNRYVNQLFGPYLQRNNMPELDTVSGFVGDTMVHALERLGKDVSADGVTMYTIGAEHSDSTVSADNITPPDVGYTFTRDSNTARALQTLADLTGGVAVTRTANFDLAFDTINRDLNSYYSLGYKPQGEGARQHKIRVKTKNPAYVVRTRQTFVTKSNDDQMEDRAIANIFVDPAKSDWAISVQTGAPRANEGKFKIPVQVTMPSTITLIPNGDKLAGSFSVYFVVGTKEGGISTVLRRPQNFSIPKDAEEGLRSQPMTFSSEVRVNPGESVLSVAVIDHYGGQMGFARTSIVAK